MLVVRVPRQVWDNVLMVCHSASVHQQIARIDCELLVTHSGRAKIHQDHAVTSSYVVIY